MRKAFGLVLAVGLAAACGKGSGGTGGSGGMDPNCPAYVVPAKTNLTTPTVSFKMQVMPILNANCGATNCHGNGTSSQGNLFLGSEAAKGSDASMVRAGIVGKNGVETTAIPLVMAGNPSKSFLMHKLDGDQCLFNNQCAGKTCLAMMPSGLGQLLPIVYRDTIRRWIAQGALDN